MNELEKMKKFADRHQKGLGAFVKLNAGNVPYNNFVFNNSVNTGQGMAESLNKTYFYPKGSPIYSFGNFLRRVDKDIYTEAPSLEKAVNNITYKIKRSLGYRENTRISILSDFVECTEDYEIDDRLGKPFINSPEYNFDDPDREDEYEVENYLKESNNNMDKYQVITDHYKYNNFAVDLAYDIVDRLNAEEYDGIKEGIYEEVDTALIEYENQWELLKAYQTPETANYYEAVEELIDDLLDLIEENPDYEEEEEED
jgi:hypothetical protein